MRVSPGAPESGTTLLSVGVCYEPGRVFHASLRGVEAHEKVHAVHFLRGISRTAGFSARRGVSRPKTKNNLKLWDLLGSFTIGMV
jgi:hypothetical protein